MQLNPIAIHSAACSGEPGWIAAALPCLCAAATTFLRASVKIGLSNCLNRANHELSSD